MAGRSFRLQVWLCLFYVVMLTINTIIADVNRRLPIFVPHLAVVSIATRYLLYDMHRETQGIVRTVHLP